MFVFITISKSNKFLTKSAVELDFLSFFKDPMQSSQLAQFSTYKTKLQNKQYNFTAPQVESHDVEKVIHFTIHV